jgi:cellobiose phosphorylase
MDAALSRLDTPYGLAQLLPAYQLPDKNIGTTTRFSPGMRENGGIITIATAWAVIAECMLGHGSRAYDIFRRSLSAVRSMDQDRYSAEPYICAEYVTGHDSGSPGQGSFTWTSGVAAWMWRACIDWICGIRPDYAGLRLDPCIPSYWKEFTVVRPFREAIYRVHVQNPDGVEKGVREISVDGRKARDNRAIYDYRDHKLHEIEVIMGST